MCIYSTSSNLTWRSYVEDRDYNQSLKPEKDGMQPLGTCT